MITGCGSDPPVSTNTGTATGSQDGPATEAPVIFGPWWDRARTTQDPLDIAELAHREGGAGLVLGLGSPRFAEVARSALPTAIDASLAIAPLAERVRSGGADAEASAEALLDVLAAPVVIGERLDPEGEARAVEDLLTVANDVTAPRRLRALAVSALRRLAARGTGDPAQIPNALDEP